MPDGLFGQVVIYNIAGVDPVRRDELENWFGELELDRKYLPGPPRQHDAYEKATSTAKTKYPLGGRRPDHRRNGQTVTLMMRDVARDETRTLRHLVRELADHGNEELSYEVCLAVAEFVFSTDPAAPDGAGDMTLDPADAELDLLGADERDTVTDLLAQIKTDYEARTQNIGGDRLRKMLRDYIEGELSAVRIHPGVYFVHRRHAPALVLRVVSCFTFG